MSSPLAVFRRRLAESAVQSLGLPHEHVDALEKQIKVPERGRGDLALPCFDAARIGKQKPPEAAAKVAADLEASGAWAKVEAVNAYVNVEIAPAELAAAIVPQARDAAWGQTDEGVGKTVVIDFSSPNIAKPLAFHHVRSTVIGAAIGRIFEAHGYQVAGINYLGDWGKQFGLLATGFARYGDPDRRGDAKHLVEVYVKANAEADVDAVKAQIEAPEKARAAVAELEAARAELDGLDGKEKKKHARRVKSLEKRLRGQRGLGEDADPLAELDGWYADLEQIKAAAEARRPEVEARDQEARLFFKKLEDGDEAAVAEWKAFRETSLAEFERVYERMRVTFYAHEGESFYNQRLDAAIAAVDETVGTRESEGALVVDMPYADGEPPAILKTRDGTTLYLTRDIAAALDRHARFDFEHSLYVVASDQAFHFSQLIKTLSAMGKPWAAKMQHVPFGRVHGMSTRRGNVIFLDEVLDEAVRRAREVCEGSEKIDREHLDETVEAIGVGAVVFADLKNLRTTDYTFSWDEAVRLDGFSGPYVQYSHARLASILNKAGGAPAGVDLSRLTLEEERNLLLALSRFPEAMEQAKEQLEPSLVTRCVYEIAQATASWLTAGKADRDKRVLVEGDDGLRGARLQLVDATKNTLAHGLSVLGVVAPDAM